MIEFLVGTVIIFYGVRLYKFFTSSAQNPTVKHLLLLAVDTAVLALIIFQLILPAKGRLPESEATLVLPFVGGGIALFGALLSSWARVHMGGSWQSAWAEGRPQKLITSGPFRLVRHPVYLGTLLFGLGFEIALWNWLIFGLFGAAPVLIATALREENGLTKQFGDEWSWYAARTKRFIPYIF